MKKQKEMEWCVEFITHDGKVKHTLPMSKLGAELAMCLTPGEARVVPFIETEQEAAK